MRRFGAGVLAVVLSGCVNATFTKTVPTFAAHPVALRPEVFVDRLPPRPYDSVGIIEVVAPQSASLSEILRAAATKGQKVGCDVVVDRAIHRIAGADLPRWTIEISDAPPLESRANVSPYLGVINGPLVTPTSQPTTVYQQSSPPDKREFICGIYRSEGDAPPAAAPGAP